MRTAKKHAAWLAACASLAAWAHGSTHDGEWPPQYDPGRGQPITGAHMQPGEFRIDIPQEFRAWLEHQHLVCEREPYWGDYPVSYTFADVDGVDDGQLGIVVYVANEILFAGNMIIDETDLTDSGAHAFEPLWYWKAPHISCTPPSVAHCDSQARPVMVAELDGDPSNGNEVAFAAYYPNGERLLVVRQPSAPGSSPCGFSVPPADELALAVDSGFSVGEWTSLCRVDPLPESTYPDCQSERWHLWSHNADGSTLAIYTLCELGGSYHLILRYKASDSQTLGDPQKTPVYNALDIDGDGFDEFTRNGHVDFVDLDASGNPVPTNPVNPSAGVMLWWTGASGGQHMDSMYTADFDPLHSGLEVNSTPEHGWNTSCPQIFVDQVDVMWEFTQDPVTLDWTGCVLHENNETPGGNGQHSQIVYAGNWSSSRAGLESIYTPKTNTGVRPNNTSFPWGTYATSARAGASGSPELLVVDGANFVGPGFCEKPIHTGPCNWISQIDWDGIRLRDEMLVEGFETRLVFAMREKGDWGSSQPEWMPECCELCGPAFTSSCGNSHIWYLHVPDTNPTPGDCDDYFVKGCDNDNCPTGSVGAPGVGSHYYEKLAEDWPHREEFVANPSDFTTFDAANAFDLLGDYREEWTAVGTNGITIYYNDAPLANPKLHPSPRLSESYLRFRMMTSPQVNSYGPYVYEGLPIMESLEIASSGGCKVFGMNLNAISGLEATAHYSDGSSADVTDDVDWSSDETAIISVFSGGAVWSHAIEGSARITATLGTFRSNSAWVYASSSTKPAILTAGYGESYLVEDDTSRSLKLEARVAHKNGCGFGLVVEVLDENGSPWWVPGEGYVQLYDDGDAANEDEEAGDGIYSRVVDFGFPTHVPDLGDHLFRIRARTLGMNPSTSQVWPFLVVGLGGGAAPTLTDDHDNDAQGESRTPKVRQAGLRGISFPGYAVIEAQVVEPTDPNLEIVTCRVLIPEGVQEPGNDPIVVTMEDMGGGFWKALVEVSHLAPGLHLVQIIAEARDTVTNELVQSDTWPRLRVHAP